MRHVFNFCAGRSTFFALALLAIGSILAFVGKLTADFVALGGLIHGFVVYRALQQDPK